MADRPGTFRVNEVAQDGAHFGTTRVVARYVLALTSIQDPGGTMIRMQGGDPIFSDEPSAEIWKRWKECA